MAALLSAANAKIRSHPVLSYVCSTHFWGPVSNFGIPIAAVMDTQKEAEIISGKMTTALIVYSATFMRYALAVQPRNYLLFGCHLVNECAQLTQGYRYLDYWNWGGRQRDLARLSSPFFSSSSSSSSSSASGPFSPSSDTTESKSPVVIGQVKIIDRDDTPGKSRVVIDHVGAAGKVSSK